MNPQSLDLRCLSEAPALLSELFAGTPTRTPALFSCLDRTLLAFSSHTRGESREFYSLLELRAFANRHLPPEHPVSDAFARSLLKIKRALSGGSEERLLRGEFDVLRKKLARLGILLAPLSRHLPVLTRLDSGTPMERREAGTALSVFLEGITEWFSDSPNPLAWEELRGFFRELEAFTDKDDRSILPLIIEQIPVFQCLKLLLVGGDEALIENAKWGPLLRSISHFYSTLLVTRNPPELLEQLSLEVVSTREEQFRATARLTALLKVLIRDDTLRSSALLKAFSDRYAKALLMNALAFPETQGSIALRPFLGTAALRKLTGELILASANIVEILGDPPRLQVLADQAASVLEQAALSSEGRSGSPPAGLDIEKLLTFFDFLEPLLDSSQSPERIRSALRLIAKAVPVLTGKDPSSLSARDLRVLIQKSLDLRLLWTGQIQTRAAAGMLEVLSRPPRAGVIPLERIQALIDEAMPLLADQPPDGHALLEKFRRGLRLKALLLGGPVDALLGRELDQLAYLAQAFRAEDDVPGALLSLSNLLRNRGFRSCDLHDLLSTLEPLLPARAQQAIRNESGQIRYSALGVWKAIAVGGTTLQVTGPELADLSRLTGLALRALPSPFHLGMNADTTNFLRSALLILQENRRGDIPLRLLGDALGELFQGGPPAVRRSSIDTFLIGLHTRIIRNLRTPKPGSLEGLVISTRDLAPWIELLEKITPDLRPLDPEEARKRAALARIIPFVFGHYHPSGELAVEDLRDLLSDINPLAFDLGLTWGYTPAEISAPARRRTIDLFTPSGNGNGKVDAPETLEFLTLAQEGRILLDRAVGTLLPACFPGLRVEDIREISRECLSRNFFQQNFLVSLYGESRPGFAREILGLNESALQEFQQALLLAAVNRPLASPLSPPLSPPLAPPMAPLAPLQRSDFESLAAVPVFLEDLFGRLDRNRDDRLVFSEAMRAFPLFCREIKEAGGPGLRGSCTPGEDPDQVEAVFGYLLFRKTPPRGVRSEDSLWRRLLSARELFGWFRFWNQLDRTPSVRDASPPTLSRADLLALISKLSQDSGPGAPDSP